MLGGNNQKLWQRLCAVIGREELVEDPASSTTRPHGEPPGLVAELERALAARDTQDWVEVLLEAGVPAGPIHDYEQAVADPHTLAREMVVEMEHPEAGTVTGSASPSSSARRRAASAAPRRCSASTPTRS